MVVLVSLMGRRAVVGEAMVVMVMMVVMDVTDGNKDQSRNVMNSIGGGAIFELGVDKVRGAGAKNVILVVVVKASLIRTQVDPIGRVAPVTTETMETTEQKSSISLK